MVRALLKERRSAHVGCVNQLLETQKFQMAPYLYNIYILALDTSPSISELPETKRITWAKNQKGTGLGIRRDQV